MHTKSNLLGDGNGPYVGREVRTPRIPIQELAELVGDLGELRRTLLHKKVTVSSRIGRVELEHAPGFVRGGDIGTVILTGMGV